MPDGIAAAEWRGTLAGITAAQMAEGFDADTSRGDAFPPSSTQFRAMCLGIPSLASVKSEIDDRARDRGQSIISRFSRGVWSRLDVYAYRTSADKDARARLRDAYELTKTFVMEGGVLPLDPVALIEKQVTPIKPAPPEVVKAHLERMRNILREPDPEDAA
jgi:hypothetical protein